jgi:hypothetical protein
MPSRAQARGPPSLCSRRRCSREVRPAIGRRRRRCRREVPAGGAGRWARPGPSTLAPPARTSSPCPRSATPPPPSPPPPALPLVRPMDAFLASRAAEIVDTDHDDVHLKALHAVGRRGRQRNPGDRRRHHAKHWQRFCLRTESCRQTKRYVQTSAPTRGQCLSTLTP